MTDLPSYPIVVGVTGDRDIATDAQEALRVAVHVVLAGLTAKFGDALHCDEGARRSRRSAIADTCKNSSSRLSPCRRCCSPPIRLPVANQDRLDH